MQILKNLSYFYFYTNDTNNLLVYMKRDGWDNAFILVVIILSYVNESLMILFDHCNNSTS